SAEGSLHFARIPNELDAATTASGRGLKQHRITDLLRLNSGLKSSLGMIGAGYRCNAGRSSQLARGELIAHLRDVVGAWADKGNSIIDAGLGKLGSLG